MKNISQFAADSYPQCDAEPYLRTLPAAGTTLDRSILLDPPAPALVAPKYEFSKLENGPRSQKKLAMNPAESYPLVMSEELLKMAIEIVDLPMINGDFP